jgi:hypothetical protein
MRDAAPTLGEETFVSADDKIRGPGRQANRRSGREAVATASGEGIVTATREAAGARSTECATGDWLVGPAARQGRDLPLAVTLRAAARRAAARPAQAVAAHESAAAYALEPMSRRTDFGPACTTALMPPDGCRNTVDTAILHCSRACQRCHDAGRAGRGQATRQAQIAVTPAWNTPARPGRRVPEESLTAIPIYRVMPIGPLTSRDGRAAAGTGVRCLDDGS